MELLTSVAVVLRARADALLGCAEVARIIDAFVDGSAHWSVYAAVARGDVRLVQQLVTTHSALAALSNDTVSAALAVAAQSGRLDIIACVHASLESRIVLSNDVLDAAARNGHVHVLQWQHTHRPDDSGSTAAMDSAAAQGHLDVVQWLHTHRTEDCTSAAMDSAAAHGHLLIVKWLHTHRTEGCTTKAMDSAAAAGSLDIVRWLHDHRTEGCTAEAMNGAAGNGHLHVVRWLFNHRRRESDPTSAYRRAALHGRNDIVKWIRKRMQC